jgi:formate hydrogenlyase subunit 3/multisubunit Na+/H+ antiporter MnhD subunit
MTAVAAAIALALLAALLTLWIRPTARATGIANAAAIATASLACALPSARSLASGETQALLLRWPVPGGALALGLDPLSAFFLLPAAALAAATACFGAGYLAQADARRARLLWACFDALVAGIWLVLVARNAVLFVVAWEAMTLAAWALVAFGQPGEEARRAGWIYLVASHVGAVALLLLFAILADASGGRASFDAIAAHGRAGPPAGALLALGLLGFGVKAGVIPLHVWLPEAHAAAPSHVSALMSGAMVKLGFYGLLRLALLVGPPPAAAGLLLAALGLAGALLAISLALYQRDLKRALAYSSVENLGLIAFGLGVAAWASARGHAALALFALMAALLHVWNHAAMKGLLFLASGALVHGAGTRDLERLGGLLRRLPVAGTCFLWGAVAISGLPPGNAFASEWLLQRGLAELALGPASGAGVAACLAIAAVALVGGLAAACFVRLVGIALLGVPRGPEAAAAHEGGLSLRAPLLALAAACAAFALAPAALVRLCGPLAEQLLGPTLSGVGSVARTADAIAPVGLAALAVWTALAAGATLAAALQRGRRQAPDETWGCGYAAPSARMQYSARSFAELLAERWLPRWLAPRVRVPAPRGAFPAPIRLATEEGDPLVRGAYEPLFDAFATRFARLRALQQGNAHLYLGYVLMAVLAALAWVSVRARWAP